MDTLRGNFGSTGYDGAEFDGDPFDTDALDAGADDDDLSREGPPAAIGTDERRMQVRAYNHWASQLDDRSLPSIEDLEPSDLPDFGPFSVLLDFTAGIENPGIEYLGPELAKECGTDIAISDLADVPSRSLLSRITDHYMQIIANQAPIGFEAEFVNQRGATILYRGILLPYSSDGDTIDFIYGVINWKEVADQVTTDELLLEIDQALENDEPDPGDRSGEPIGDWADGPGSEVDGSGAARGSGDADRNGVQSDVPDPSGFPAPAFGMAAMDDGARDDPADADDAHDDEDEATIARLSALIQPRPDGERKFVDLGDPDGSDDATGGQGSRPRLALVGADGEADGGAAGGADGGAASHDARDHAPPMGASIRHDPDAGLHDCLAEARELADRARSSEDRTRHALYAAVGRAYDVSLAARERPQEFAELMVENGLTVQERAPMTPVVKLVFGADYDKTRLTEYAAVLSHARRLGIERGSLSAFLGDAEGGLKGVVRTERRLRREEAGADTVPHEGLAPALAGKLRDLDTRPLSDIDADGPEFALVMVRRMGDGGIVMLGDFGDDIALTQKAARILTRQ